MMTEAEIVNEIKSLWWIVSLEWDVPEEIESKLNQYLSNYSSLGSDEIKNLGTTIYRMVRDCKLPHGDKGRDGMRAVSHFLMAAWDIKCERVENSIHRIYVATRNKERYFEHT